MFEGCSVNTDINPFNQPDLDLLKKEIKENENKPIEVPKNFKTECIPTEAPKKKDKEQTINDFIGALMKLQASEQYNEIQGDIDKIITNIRQDAAKTT